MDNPVMERPEQQEELFRSDSYLPGVTLEVAWEPAPSLLPYPSNPFYKTLSKGPVLMWRLGLGPVLGRLFMILTTRGRKSGLPRHTPVEFREFAGRKYVYDAHGARSDWYRNIEADSRVTIQTARGTEGAIARRVVDDAELEDAYSLVTLNPLVQQWTKELGPEAARQRFLAEKERFFVLTFDPSYEATPTSVDADLVWVWGVVLAALGLAFALLLRIARRNALNLNTEVLHKDE